MWCPWSDHTRAMPQCKIPRALLVTPPLDSIISLTLYCRLDAYYVFIHPFLPILPPPDHIPVDRPIPRLQNQIDVFEEGFEPTSPISLAISAILALIPCPEDANHASRDSQLFRRKYAQYFAQTAFETMENDEEIPDSAIDPSRPLSEDHNHAFRRPFHQRVPVELESIVALDVLSVYEYAQRGNIKKMQNRAGQALMAAMDMSLHSCATEDEYSEARRRIWWMTVRALDLSLRSTWICFTDVFPLCSMSV